SSARGAGAVGHRLSYARDSGFLAVGQRGEGTVVGWSTTSGKELWRLSWKSIIARNRGVWSLAVSPDRKTIAVASSDDWLGLCEGTTSSLRFKMKRQAMKVIFSPDGKYLASLGYPRGDICLWDWYRGAGTSHERLSNAELERLWRGLGSKDAAFAFRAVRR